MKYLVILFLLLGACSKHSGDKAKELADKPSAQAVTESKSEVGPFELFLGIHSIEYFADRMVLKSRLSGYDFAKKTTFEKDGVILHQVVLGPFKTKAEAEKAEQEIKSRAPDLDISKVRSIK